MTLTRAKNSANAAGALTAKSSGKKKPAKKAIVKRQFNTTSKGSRKTSRVPSGSYSTRKSNSQSKAKAASGKTAKLSVVAVSSVLKEKTKKTSLSPLAAVVLRAMEDIKAVNVTTLDVRGVTDIADTMVIASGNSDRHVRAIAERVVEFAKQSGFRPMGIEGERDNEWVLVDLTDVIVHVMLPRVREFYRLESLWDVTAARREAAAQ